eukprot:gene56508-77441_t
MAGRLEGKVALITGGVSGIGLGTVELFAQEGACVVAADLQDEKGAMLEKRFDGRIRYAHCDVTSEADIAAAVKMAADQFGGLDILFNNAGHGGAPGNVSEVDVEAWDKTFALLVRGPAVGARRRFDLPLEFFARVIWQESRFQADAVGPVTRSGHRAQGIAQFMPGTANERRLLDPFDPVQALPKSAEFLSELRGKFGNLGLAAAAYNAGPRH